MNLDTFLLALLLAVCVFFIWLDIRGISLSSLARRIVETRRVRKNLMRTWKSARAILGGRKCL